MFLINKQKLFFLLIAILLIIFIIIPISSIEDSRVIEKSRIIIDDNNNLELKFFSQNLLIGEVLKQYEKIKQNKRDLTIQQHDRNNNNNNLTTSNLIGKKIFNVQVTGIHVDKAEFPLSKLLFKLTLKLALSAAEKRLESSSSSLFRKIKFSLNIRSANTCSRQYAGAIAAEEYYLKKARLFIVSGCDDAIRGVSRLASGWRIPIMTAAGFGADLNDKLVHKTLIRVAFSLKTAVKFLIKILKSFSWQKVNLIVDESDPNSYALKDSIEKHLLQLKSNEFQLYLNTISLDLQSLIISSDYNNNNNNNEKLSSESYNNYSTTLNKKSFLSSQYKLSNNSNWYEDKWPNEITEKAVRNALRQSSLFSRVNILLIPQNYLRKFMLSVYDQNMANGLYTFINMPLLLMTSTTTTTTTTTELGSPSSLFDQTTTIDNIGNRNNTKQKQHQQQQQQQSSYSASAGENIFIWRSLKSNRNSQAKQAFESLMSIYLRTPTTKAYVYFTGKLLNLANANYATTTTTTKAPNIETIRNNSLTSSLGIIKQEGTSKLLNTPIGKIQLNINPYSASFYDCFQIYASALNESYSIIEKQLQQSNFITKTTLNNGTTLNNRIVDNNDNSFNSIRSKNLISNLHYRIVDLIKNRRYENMVTGSIIINENGDRETDYTLDDMNPMTGKFMPVILFKGESKEIERLSRIHWSSDETVGPTIDNVDCYLNGTCASKPWSKFLVTLVLISIPMGSIMSLILYFVYKQINLESQLVDYWWKISLKEIEIVETRRKQAGDGSSVVNGGSQVSIFSKSQQLNSNINNNLKKQGTINEDDCTDISDKASNIDNKKMIKADSEFAKTSVTKVTTTNTSGFASTAADVCYGDIQLGIYKLAKVALKPIGKFNQSRKLMIELRTIKNISHNNLCRFIGIIIEEPTLALVSEFCPKGSLREFFQNESMVIDWTFKYSIINDIMAGLLYLHSSQLEFHGRLKSSNCLVSSRFVVKLSDYGLRSLHEQLDDNEDDLDLLKKKIWLAPEHLQNKTIGNLNKGGSIKGDVYSFGLLLYEIITNRIPFFDLEKNDFIMPLKTLYNELKNKGISQDKTGPNLDLILKENNENVNGNKDIDSLINLMKRSWIYDPNKRLTMQEANATIKRITRGVTSKKLLENLTSRMEQYTNNLESLVEAKLATLLDEKLKAEELLYQFVPKSVALLLKDGESVEPEAFDCVTVFYSDIVGFTSLSSESSPMEVIDFLSELYLCFDETLEHYDIFKVDTIGDAYIVASGLPKRNDGKHVIEIARAALELRDRISSFKIPHKPNRKLQMRVGINSGPCIAGIVGGVNMPKYCVFGDTLTTGKFMESSGLPMKIHITEESKILLDGVGGFKIEPRTPKISKDGLPLQTYWLETS